MEHFIVQGPLVTGSPGGSVSFHPEACFEVLNDRIKSFWPDSKSAKLNTQLPIRRYPTHALICPGFFDLHTHFAQRRSMCLRGRTLLDWLNSYIFPEEMDWIRRQGESGFLESQLVSFFHSLVASGTTTAVLFGVSNLELVDRVATFFSKRGLRVVTGPCVLDRNAPEALQFGKREEERKKVEAWIENFNRNHGFPSICPRYAPACSEELLKWCGTLMERFSSLYLQTHISETLAEVAWVRELFPRSPSYAHVYWEHQLLGPRALLAHGIHLEHEEKALIASTEGKLITCPSANRFLGSGDFRWDTMGDLVSGIGTDVGAGTGYNTLRCFGLGYEIALSQGLAMEPELGLELVTQKAAKALGFKDSGFLGVGARADFVVLDGGRVWCEDRAGLWVDRDWRGKLFLAQTMSDCSPPVAETWVAGRCAFDFGRPSVENP